MVFNEQVNFKNVALFVMFNISDIATYDRKDDMVYILLWTDKVSHPFDHINMGQDVFISRRCDFQNCYITANNSYLPEVTDFDVILLDAMDIYRDIGRDRGIDLPKQRSPKQNYIFISTESPINKPIPPMFDGIFNWTWTYKLDSDIKFPYIVIKNQHGDFIGPKDDIHWIDVNTMKPISEFVKNKLKNKNKTAAWFVSNCTPNDKRDVYAGELQLELDKYGHSLDIYGFCGNLECPREAQNCLEMVESDYYFYLAFENSFSEDYVTEKLLTALQHFAVPVVYGGADYSRFMPDGIYLDARVLKPKELAQKMINLTLDKEEYYEFFKWRKYYSYHDPTESPETDPYCLLCKALNDKRKEENTVYSNFSDWWNRQTNFNELLE